MSTFKSKKGKVLTSVQSTACMKLTIHEKTDPALLKMFMDAVGKKDDEASK